MRLRQAVAGRRVVWVHAVSVGEVLAVARLVEELDASLDASLGADEPWQVVVSTTTRTGQALARERFGAERVFWFPLDFAWAIRAWMRVLRPAMVVLVESELWPRLLAECARRGVPVAVVNARLSDRSFRRARRMLALWGQVLRGVTLFLAQSEETAERLRLLGVAAQAVRVAGNLKYDVQPRETEMGKVLRPLTEQRPLVVAGSLLAPEEKLLLEGWPEVLRGAPEALLLLAPRHPERFDEVAEQVSAPLVLYRASDLMRSNKEVGRPELLSPFAVILLDTVGDLATIYGLAAVAFVGGSLARKGGHNPLEPARFGVPVVVGPSQENFREIVAKMLAVGGLEIVHTPEELVGTLAHLLKDRTAATALGQRGQQVFAEESGATRRCVAALQGLLGQTAPQIISAAEVAS